MKLYFSKGACSLVVRIVINELDLKCEYIEADLKTKKLSNGDDFLKVNPKGAVPSLETDEGEILTENAVILQYLADTNDGIALLPAIPDFKRYRVLEWLNFITTEIHKGFGPLFNPNFPEEVKQSIVIPLLKSKFKFVNMHMKGPYLFGAEITLPDPYLFVVLMWAKKFKFDLTDWPNLHTFFETMSKRPAVVKSLKEEGLL